MLNKTILACCSIIMAMPLFTTPQSKPIHGQALIFEKDGLSACGFQTIHGVYTADHVSIIDGTLRSASIDIQLLRAVFKDVKSFTIGTGKPTHFRTRRGKRIRLDVTDSNAVYWTTKQRFFGGESGLPVFDSDDNVVGVVTGCIKRTGTIKWFGTVAKISKFNETFSDELKSKPTYPDSPGILVEPRSSKLSNSDQVGGS